MSDMGKELETAVETAVPVIGIPLQTAKLIVVCLLVLAILGGASWVIWKLFFAERAAEVKHDQVAAHAQQVVGHAEAAAGAKAANTVASDAQKETAVHEITRDHYVEITKAAGAGDPVPDAVWDAFERSVCVRASAAGLPDCQRL